MDFQPCPSQPGAPPRRGHRPGDRGALGLGMAAAHSRIQARRRSGHAPAAASGPMRFKPFGLSPSVVVLASTHFLVDGFGNVLSPLLPLLIPRLDLSLAAAGTLQMCFQLANSVSQLGFGHVADRWRPRVLLIAGPIVALSVLPFVGLAANVWVLAAILVVGGLGGAAFHPPAAAVVHQVGGPRRGLAMSFHITSGTLGQALAPLAFAPVAEHFGLGATPLLAVPALAVLLLVLLPRVPPIERLHEPGAAGGFGPLRQY